MSNCGILLNDGTSFLQLNSGDFYLLNDNSCVAEPGASTTPLGGGTGAESYLSWWERELRRLLKGRKKKKVAPKKLELIEELDEVILEAREQAREHEETEIYVRQLHQEVLEAAALLNEAHEARISNERLQKEIARLKEYLQEMDDEEAIILALH